MQRGLSKKSKNIGALMLCVRKKILDIRGKQVIADADIAKDANGHLCRLLREQSYGLNAVFGMTKCTGDYAGDFKKVSESFESAKSSAPAFMPTAMLPFTTLFIICSLFSISAYLLSVLPKPPFRASITSSSSVIP